MTFKSLLVSTLVGLPIIYHAFYSESVNAAIAIAFATGSYCGSYSGDFSEGREFVLNLGKGQDFHVRNIGKGDRYNISVYGSNGYVHGDKRSPDRINYQIPRQGEYYVYVESNTNYGSIKFCAY